MRLSDIHTLMANGRFSEAQILVETTLSKYLKDFPESPLVPIYQSKLYELRSKMPGRINDDSVRSYFIDKGISSKVLHKALIDLDTCA